MRKLYKTCSFSVLKLQKNIKKKTIFVTYNDLSFAFIFPIKNQIQSITKMETHKWTETWKCKEIQMHHKLITNHYCYKSNKIIPHLSLQFLFKDYLKAHVAEAVALW